MLRFSTLKDIKECERLWNSFSPKQSLFDDWTYRSCFYDPEVHELRFIVGSENGEPIGLLPLWKARNEDYYEWFGGEFPENNKVFFKPEHSRSFLRKLPAEFWLPYMDAQCAGPLGAKPSETSYYLDLSKFGFSIERYLGSFSKKHRKNLRYDLRALTNLGYKVEHNNFEHFDQMCDLNIRRFESNSFFADPAFKKSVRRLLETALARGELEMVSIIVKGELAAAEAAILHKGTYTVLLGGSNLKINNIGKLLTIEHIKNAMSKKADIIDFLSHDCGWKRLWNMEEKIWCELSREKVKPLVAAPILHS